MTKLLIALILLTGCRIPTYPKYIELEKDLVITSPTHCRVDGGTKEDGSYCFDGTTHYFPKGTKIYYEE